MFLSIVSIFCDNDYNLVESLVKSIEENIEVEHEIILMDNRDVYKNEKIDIPGNIKVISMDGNKYQFEARRRAVSECRGKYIWYIDTDDTVLKVDKNFENLNGNLICFAYAYKEGIISLPESWDYVKKLLNGQDIVTVSKEEIEKNYNFWDIIGCPLWNKWIRKDYFEELVKEIPENKVIVASEDIIYSALAYDRTDSVTLCKKAIYIYNIDVSKGSMRYMNYEKFMHIIKGRKESREIFKQLFSDSEKYDKTDESTSYFLSRIIMSDRKEDCIKELFNHFTLEEINSGLDIMKGFCIPEYIKMLEYLINSHENAA